MKADLVVVVNRVDQVRTDMSDEQLEALLCMVSKKHQAHYAIVRSNLNNDSDKVKQDKKGFWMFKLNNEDKEHIFSDAASQTTLANVILN